MWLSMLAYLRVELVVWGLMLILAVAIYLYAKRFTDHPFFVLGLTLSWEVFIGSATLEADPMTMVWGTEWNRLGALCCLFGSYTLYTTLIEMVYSHT
jgi:4-hydroxybenzoate polyprenyltransferase